MSTVNPRTILFKEEARKAIREGCWQLVESVAATLGPRGRNVLIVRNDGAPIVTKDGVTVADELELADGARNGALRILRSAAGKTAECAGDGTTTATVIAGAITEVCLAMMDSNPKVNPVLMKRGIDEAAQTVVKRLEDMATPVTTPEQVARVAAIACNNDAELGKLIADTIQAVGPTGAILTELSPEKTYYKVVAGYQVDAGLSSPYFATDADTMTCKMTRPRLLVYAGEIQDINDILELVNSCKREHEPLVIVASGFDLKVLQILVMNKLQAGLMVCCVKAPGWGTRRDNLMLDLALIGGTQVFTTQKGDELRKITRNQLGTLRDIMVDARSMVARQEEGNARLEESVSAAVGKLIEQSRSASDEPARKAIAERIGKLTSGIGVIYVGAKTKTDAEEIRYRVDDAIHATRAAIESGILPGGGTALLRVSNALVPSCDDMTTKSADFITGYKALLAAITHPFTRIMENAGFSFQVVRSICDTIAADTGTLGFDVLNGETCDLIERGVIDPLRVTREAVLNAASAAGTLITTSVIIVEQGEAFGADQLK